MIDQGDMKEMKVVASEGPAASAPNVCLNKNNLICFLILVVTMLAGVVVGMSTTPSPYTTQPSPTNPTGVATNPPAVAAPLHLQEAVAKADELEQILHDYYGSDTWKAILSSGMGIPLTADSASATEYVSRNIIRSLLLKKNYTIGVIGSSVAAGHDNCNYDSYERQLQRKLSPIWKAAGVDVEVRNAGEGGSCGDSHRNQIFCVVNEVGADVDVVHYSWTYFEGRDAGFLQHEMITRWSLMLPKAPPVLFVNAGGQLNECFTDEKNEKILKTYNSKYGLNAVCLESALFGNGKYVGKEWGKIGDGLHNVTRYGAEETDEHRRDSLGVVWRNWHPGPLGFELLSDIIAHNTIQALRKAVVELTRCSTKNKRDCTLDDFAWSKQVLMADDLPKPLYCDPTICSLEDAPGCLNFEKPTYGWHQVSTVAKDDTLNPYTGEILGAEEGGWKVRYTAPSSRLIPKREAKLPQCQHLDSCGFLEAKSPSAQWAVFKLPKMTKGTVVVCGCCGKDVGKTMFLENENIEIQFDGKTLNRSTFILWPEKKCVRVLEKFPAGGLTDAGGHVYLGIRIIKPTNIAISHVITI